MIKTKARAIVVGSWLAAGALVFGLTLLGAEPQQVGVFDEVFDEKPGITIAGGHNLIGSSGILVEIKPEVCESKLYHWDGENLRCATVDRVGHVKVQRNHNMRALKVCRAEVNYLRGAALLAAMNNEQRAACREMGKVFDEIEVICTGSLTPGEEK